MNPGPTNPIASFFIPHLLNLRTTWRTCRRKAHPCAMHLFLRPTTPTTRSLQLPGRHFFELHNVPVTVILQANPACIWPSANRRLPIVLPRWRCKVRRLGEVRDFRTVHDNHRPRPVECDVHGVPHWAGLARARHRLGEGVEHSGSMKLVVVVVDLHLKALIHRHPWLGGLFPNTDEHARVVVLISHPVHHLSSQCPTGPPVQ